MWLHLALDHRRSSSAASARWRRGSAQISQGVADRRQRVAQLVRERGEELVLAPVRLAQRLFLPPALGDVGEPDGQVPFAGRGDHVEPAPLALYLHPGLEPGRAAAAQRADRALQQLRIERAARHEVSRTPWPAIPAAGRRSIFAAAAFT